MRDPMTAIPSIWPVQIWQEQAYVCGDPQPLMWAEAEALRDPPILFTVSEPDPFTRDFAWGLSRIWAGDRLNQVLQPTFGLEDCFRAWVAYWQQTPSQEVHRVLIALELIVRGIPMVYQNHLKTILGDDVLRAAYQMNMVCIDPENRDRTLLQVQRLGIRLAGDQGSRIRTEIQLVLSDGRRVDPL